VKRSWLAPAAVGGATLAFTVGVLWYYHFRPTVGAFVLVIGWSVLIGAAWLLARAAAAFDLEVEDPVFQTNETLRREELEQEKKMLLKAIKELEFDKQMGKIDDKDAAAAVTRYRARAVEILRQLDDATGGKTYEAMVEKELVRRLGATPALEEKAPSPGTCADCGTANDTDAVFCKKCGKKVSA
jgi:hypothetical protein